MSQRLQWLDIAKGIGIVSVFYGHCTQSLCNELFLYIYSYHMPLFFILSGICFNKERYSNMDNAGDFLVRRTKQLLIPLLSSMLFFCFLKQVFNIGSYGIDRFCDFGFPPAMWFVFSLLVIEILYFIFISLFHGSKILDYVILITSFCIACVIAKNGYIFPANLSSVPIGMFFFVSGILSKGFISKYYSLLVHNKFRYAWTLLLAFIPLIYISIIKTPINLMEGTIPNSIILPICIAFIGVLAMMSISIIIEQYKTNKLQQLLIYLGRNTLIILMFHLFFINVSKEYLRPLLGGIGTEPLTAWIWLFITIPIVNRYFPFLAGKGIKQNCSSKRK